MRKIREYGFVPIMLAALIAVALMYFLVDDVQAAEVPDEIKAACEKYGEEYCISPEFLEAIAYQESTFNPRAVDRTGTCHGLMQISYSAHGERMKKLGVTDIYSIDGNIHTAADFLRELFEQCENPAVVLARYNGQSDKKVYSAEYDGFISTYADNILKMSAELEREHGK